MENPRNILMCKQGCVLFETTICYSFLVGRKFYMKRGSGGNSAKLKPSPKKGRKDYDHNNPVRRCSVCYTLSGWHCYDCGKDYCGQHFQAHKDNNQCK